MARRPHILIIGGASVDRLRAEGQPITTPGGAALYTAVAARKAGAVVRFFGFKPDPLPELFHEAARMVDWVGPPCQIEDIPHFEIIYDERGDARLGRASWGREDQLDPAMVPDALLEHVDYIHIAAIHDPALQMKFVQTLRRRSSAKLSAGTFGYMVHRAPDAVRALQEATDLFFLNGFEADLVFGNQPPTVRPGQILVITRGADGADVWQGDWCTRVPCYPAQPVDLTGAGDSVCGGALAGLVDGLHPVQAVQLGAAVAALTIEAPGMTGLLKASRVAIAQRQAQHADARVSVDEAQVEKIAAILADLPHIAPFEFTGPHFPPIDDPHTLPWFFAAMLHQFGFWTPRDGRWDQPLQALLNGERLKGSDYVFAAFARLLKENPDLLARRAQATMRWSDTEETFRADDGSVPVPVLANHHALARSYGRDMWELGWTPELLVTQAQESEHSVATLIEKLDHIPGYREDPLRKKSMLLIAALGQRPEKFIDLKDGRDLAPIIDYHLMRSCLRTGLVRVHDDALRQTLAERKLCTPADEAAVRLASYDAIQRLCGQSGRDLGTVDYFFFGARRRCPELTEPDCAHCPLDPACAKDRELFQPVLRTTFY
jgi:sugar/nucleoside kinase (ribokinase family)